jgi:hypothetical protein
MLWDGAHAGRKGWEHRDAGDDRDETHAATLNDGGDGSMLSVGLS